MIKGLFLIAVLAGYTLAGLYDDDWGKCGCCPKWCDCKCKETKPTGLDIGLAQDSSGSIDDEEWTLGKVFLARVLCGTRCPGNKVAHISFSTDVHINWNLNSFLGMNFDEALAELIGLGQFQKQATNTVKALQVLVSDVFVNGNERPGVPNIALVVTDGMTTFNETLLSTAANELHQTAKTFAVGVGQIDAAELAIIASDNANVFTVGSMEELPTLVPLVTKAINDMFPCELPKEECVCCCPPPEPRYYSKMNGVSDYGYGGYTGCGYKRFP